MGLFQLWWKTKKKSLHTFIKKWSCSPKCWFANICLRICHKKAFMMNQWKKRSRMYELHDFYHQHIHKYYTALILYPWEQNWMNGRASHFSLKSTAACASSLQLRPKIQFSQIFLPFSSGKVGFLHDWLHVSLNQGGSTHSKVGSRDPRGLHIAIGVLDDGVLH